MSSLVSSVQNFFRKITKPEPYISYEDRVKQIDGWYGWAVVFQGFLSSVMTDGSIYSFGVFLPVYVNLLKQDVGTVAWIGSIASAINCAFGIVAGYLTDTYGNKKMATIGAILICFGFAMASLSTELWQLFLTQGVICGFGYSFVSNACMSIIGQWFQKRRGAALGLAISGSGIGQFIMVNVTDSLLKNEGLTKTLQYMALIEILGLAICICLVKRLFPYVPTKGHNSIIQNARELFQDRHFFYLYMGYVVAVFGYIMPFVHLPTYCIQQGLSVTQANMLLSLIGLASACGRITIGFIADVYGKLLMVRICMVAAGVITLCWLSFTSYSALLAYSLIFGFFAGGFMALVPSVAAELFGVDRLGSMLGLLYTSMCFGFLLSSPIAGFLYEIQQSYIIPIVVAGCTMICGAVLIDWMCDTTSLIHLRTIDIHLLHDESQIKHISQKIIAQDLSVKWETSVHSSSGGGGNDSAPNSPSKPYSPGKRSNRESTSTLTAISKYLSKKQSGKLSVDIENDDKIIGNTSNHDSISSPTNDLKVAEYRRPSKHTSLMRSTKLLFASGTNTSEDPSVSAPTTPRANDAYVITAIEIHNALNESMKNTILNSVSYSSDEMNPNDAWKNSLQVPITPRSPKKNSEDIENNNPLNKKVSFHDKTAVSPMKTSLLSKVDSYDHEEDTHMVSRDIPKSPASITTTTTTTTTTSATTPTASVSTPAFSTSAPASILPTLPTIPESDPTSVTSSASSSTRVNNTTNDTTANNDIGVTPTASVKETESTPPPSTSTSS